MFGCTMFAGGGGGRFLNPNMYIWGIMVTIYNFSFNDYTQISYLPSRNHFYEYH